MASDLAKAVKKNDGYTDCDALGDFANAASYGTTTAQFVNDFAALVPDTLGTELAGIPYGSDAVSLNSGVSPSGFQSIYQNTVNDGPGWNGDQGHHFAAFLEYGYSHPSLGAAAAVAFEVLEAGAGFQGPINDGDINLGEIAAAWGAQLASGTLKPSDLSQKILSTLCKH